MFSLLRFPIFALVYLCCFFIDPAPPEIYTLSLHDALPICWSLEGTDFALVRDSRTAARLVRQSSARASVSLMARASSAAGARTFLSAAALDDIGAPD